MRRNRFIVPVLVIVAAVAAVAAVQVTATPAVADPSGCSDTGGYTVCLTDPSQYDDGKDTTVIDELRRQVAATADGDVIRVSMYEWKLTPLAEDLVAARERGVDVRVILGTPGDPDPNQPVQDILADGGIAVTQCAHSCLPNGDGDKRGPNHNKFFLIDSRDSAKVLQFSANITRGQLTHPQNLIVADDRALYDFYTGYWNRMNVGSWTYDGVTWGEGDKHGEGDRDYLKSYVFPRGRGDIVESVLKNVEACRDGDDKVWVTQSIFDAERGNVLDRLNELLDMGCDVRITVLHQDDYDWITGRFPADRVRLRDNHNKLIVVDAQYAGEWRGVVFTGSHNLSRNSLRNANDAMLRVIQPDVAATYAAYVQHLYDNGAPPR